jgi:hypothetical protein
MRISKSKFIAGVQCLKRLYLLVHQRELAGQSDDADDAIIQQGREVGLLARQLFPGGIEVAGSGGLDVAVRSTRELVANMEVPAIFEGAFEHQGTVVKTDILQRRKENRWRLVEIKSGTDLKEEHLEDVAFQGYVLSRSGLDLASIWLAHVNREYVFEGGTVDPRHFFLFRNLTHRAQNQQPTIAIQVNSQVRVLALPNPPDVPAGPHCTNPVTCEFFDHCNHPKPNYHVSRIPRLHPSAIEELAEMGVETIHDIPDDFELSEIQRRICTVLQTGKPWFSTNLKTELESLTYPLHFIDFETINPAIPRFAGMRAYDHIPFQWSVHIQKEPGAAPEHREYLAIDRSDPRNPFISSLCESLGERGTIVVYNEQFESQRLWELASWLPEYKQCIKGLQSRLWDLLPVVRNHVYHPAFGGSFSLKKVLPALVPEMTYEGMEVANGQAAGLAWETLIRGNSGETERRAKRQALLDYCGQDTLALVRLLERFRSLPPSI